MLQNLPHAAQAGGKLTYRYKVCPPEFTLRECHRDDTDYCADIIYIALLGKVYSVGAYYPVRAVEVDLDRNRIDVTFRHDADWCTAEDISETSECKGGTPDESWQEGELEASDYEEDDDPVYWVREIATDIGIPDPVVLAPTVGTTVERD